jgi:2-methylcitrate dehydratase PrpD
MSLAYTGIAQTSDYDFKDFNQKYEILDVYHKPVPGCAMIQTTAQLALEIVNAGVDYTDIKEGTIKTSYMGKHYPGCDSTGPFMSMTQARMSNQFIFAGVLYKRELSNDIFEIYDNQEINELAKKLKVEVDEEAAQIFPARQMVKVSLVLKDGSVREFIKKDLDHFTNFQDAILNKFKSYSSRLLGDKRVDEVIEAVNELEKLESVTELIELLTVK